MGMEGPALEMIPMEVSGLAAEATFPTWGQKIGTDFGVFGLLNLSCLVYA